MIQPPIKIKVTKDSLIYSTLMQMISNKEKFKNYINIMTTSTDPIEKILVRKLMTLRSEELCMPEEIKKAREKLEYTEKGYEEVKASIEAILKLYPNIEDKLKPE